MTVTLYNQSSDQKTLFKKLGSPVASVTATIKGTIDIDNPLLLLDYSSSDFNYFYLDSFGRYYNVRSRQLTPAGKIMISGESDALQSFNTQIAALPDVLAVRNEDKSKWDKNEPDPYMITKAKRVYKGYAFGSMQNIISNSDVSYVLGVI